MCRFGLCPDISADQRVCADHQGDIAGFFLDLAFVEGPAEPIRDADDLRKLVVIAFINQCSKAMASHM